MKKFIPKEKLGKKARRQLDSEQRATWTFSPVTKKVESRKLYNRKREKLMTVTMTTAWAFLVEWHKRKTPAGSLRQGEV